MARISDEIIEKLKNEISLVRLLESQGFKLKKHGKDYVCCCPFHNDKTPSLVVSPDKNLWNCLGACGEGGSVIDWVMKRETVSFRRAVEILQQDLGLIADEHEVINKQPSSLAAEQDDQALLKRVIEYYHETLKQSPEAIDYLESRGLNDAELINTFKLGFANRSLGYKLPSKTRKAGAEIRGQLQNIGIYRESGHEHFTGSVVVPVFDEVSQIKEVYGRKILGKRLRKGTIQHLYLPGEHQGIWNISSLAANEEIILCESLIDAMTFWVHGFKNVTTSYGINGFTEELLNGLINHEIKRVLIAYDRDEAGNVAAEKLAEQLKKYDIDCYRVLFPKNMDANEYALKMSPARKSLELVVRKAEPMLEGQLRVTSGELRVKEKEKEKTETKVETEIPSFTQNTRSAHGADPVAKTPQEIALPASPIAPAPRLDIPAEVTDNEVVILFGSRDAAPRRYRIRGLKKAMSYEQLKINICVSEGDLLHIDHLDLYHAKQRFSFIKQASIELGVSDEVIKKDLAKVLLKLEQLQDEQIQGNLKPEEKAIELTTEEQKEALDLLRDPNLLERILDDFNRAGVVGEETNKLVGYLAAVSRKLDEPLAVMIQSTSAAGKSALMNAILAMMPEEEKVQYSAMTGQSLFYMGETNLKHKILAIAEEEGADQASYALKLLQSEGELTMASTGKDEATGTLVTKEYKVEGPVMLFSTTTAIDIDEELMNRCIVLTVNEDREQTRLIHELQRERETLAGLLAKEDRTALVQRHKNAQRLLKAVRIINPYATQLTFMDSQTRARRDHMKYLGLIKSITLLHQHQREIKTVKHNGEVLEYIEVNKADIATANQLAHDVLGRSLDELPPQTRNLLDKTYRWVEQCCEVENMSRGDYHFSRKELRQATGWGDTQLKIHLARLVEMEYLLVFNAGKGKSYRYELVYAGEGNNKERFLMNLIDVANLTCDAKWSGLNGNRSGSGRPLVGVQSGAGRGDENEKYTADKALNEENDQISLKTHSIGENNASHHTSSSVASYELM